MEWIQIHDSICIVFNRHIFSNRQYPLKSDWVHDGRIAFAIIHVYDHVSSVCVDRFHMFVHRIIPLGLVIF
jgi:hypothetical protein